MRTDLFTVSPDNLENFRTAAPLGAAADRFKIRGNSVRGSDKQPTGTGYLLRTCRCWSRACRHCAPIMGRRVLGRLLQNVVTWRYPRMLTLTVDRSHFASPEAAYKYVTEKRLLPRLMTALGVDRYVRVLEFQMKTWDDRGRGWPHWHFVIDKVGSRGHVSYAKAWKLWRDTWKVGGVDVTNQKKMEGKSPAYIVTYLCKYLVKYPEEGFPSWILDLRNVRFVQASRSVGALVFAGAGVSGDETLPDPEASDTAEDDVVDHWPREARTLRERLAVCGESSSLFAVSPTGGEDYVSKVPVRAAVVAVAAQRGYIEGVKLETKSDGYGKQYMVVRVFELGSETREEMAYRIQEGVNLFLLSESAQFNPPPYNSGGGCESLLDEWGCASVTEFVRRYREQVKKGRAYYTELEAMEAAGALAEPPSAYLWELIQEEDRRTLPAQ